MNSVNNCLLQEQTCNCHNRASISLLEQIIITLLIMILPVHLIIMKYIKVDYSWESVNQLMITSVSFTVIFTVMLIMYFLFNKPYLAMIFGCHQIYSRTFKIFNKPFLLCARCSGILIGTMIIPFSAKLEIKIILYFLGIIPIAIDGLHQHFTSYTSTNIKRFITGFLFGPVLIVIMSYYYIFVARLIIKFTAYIT